jgi:hypothetical protein
MSLCTNYSLDPFTSIICNNMASCPLTANHFYNIGKNIPKNIIYLSLGFYIIPILLFILILLITLVLTSTIKIYTAIGLFLLLIIGYVTMAVFIILVFKNFINQLPQIALKAFQETETLNKIKCFSS